MVWPPPAWIPEALEIHANCIPDVRKVSLDALPSSFEIAVQCQPNVPEGFAVGTAENDFCPQHLPGLQGPAPSHLLQALSLLFL
jgi:hypothetical protein